MLLTSFKMCVLTHSSLDTRVILFAARTALLLLMITMLTRLMERCPARVSRPGQP